MLERTHPRVRGRKRFLRPRGSFYPTQLGAKLSAWLRLAASTPNAGEYDVVVDVLNSNPTSQTDADRKPAASTAANGLPVADWDGTDVLVWPVHASNNQVDNTGFALWMKLTGVAAANVSIVELAGGTSATKLSMQVENAKARATAYISGNNGRTLTSTGNVFSAGVWAFYRLAYVSSIGGDLCLKLYVNEVAVTGSYTNTGAGGTLGVLPTVTGNVLLGGQSNSDTPFFSPIGSFGPNIYCIAGDLTAAEGAALMAFDRPT